MGNWQVFTVSDLVDKEIIFPPMDGNHGEIHPKGDDFVENGIPFIMASDLNDQGDIDLTGCKFICENQAKSLRNGYANEGDVLLSHKATIGRTATSSEWSSSGFSNEGLTADTTSTLNMLDQGADADIAESMGVAAMVTLAANAKSMLKGEALSTEAKQKIIQDGVVAASVAGLVQLIL